MCVDGCFERYYWLAAVERISHLFRDFEEIVSRSKVSAEGKKRRSSTSSSK